VHSTKGTAGERGTGLGLMLCKEFIEKMAAKSLWIAKWAKEQPLKLFCCISSKRMNLLIIYVKTFEILLLLIIYF
jgi:K+-sensing histidine kinase KdpD